MKKYINCKLIVSLLLVFGSFQLQAQNNWDGDNAIGRFTFCDNWFANACPGTWNSTTDLNIQIKNNGSQTTMYLDYGGWRDINNLTYFATYTSSVTQFDADGPLFNENGLNFYGKIENYSPNLTQVFNLPFHGRNALKIELNPINGGLTFNRTIFNSGNRNFEVYGPNSRKVTLNGYPEGNNTVGFYIKENSIVEVNYNNVASLSGGYFVERGELWVESNGVIQGGIQVGLGNANANKLYISNPSVATTVANAITVFASSSNATIGSLNTSNTHTYSGTINLNNNNVNIDVVSAGGTVNFANTISGTGGIRKINPGLARLSAANSYTGTTTINAGTLQYGVANAIANASNVILNGGTFSTGAGAGFSDTVGTLQLTANSTIALGTGDHRLTFAASSGVPWAAGTTLTITGWTNNCAGKVFVGTNNTALTTAQLAQITFQGYPAGAKISPVGELIPNNVLLTATLGTLQGSYATLSAAFAAMNASTHKGNISISVLNDIDEGTATATLNNNAAIASVLIQPAGCGPRTISGATTAGNPLIDLNGADNVTIDGLNSATPPNPNLNSLTFTNTNFSNTSGTCTIRFQNDAIDNIITNCSIFGSASMASGTFGGNICFGVASGTGVGNDNNTISNCNIGAAGVSLPTKGIYFSGTPGRENNNITITNNNIYDFFSSTVASAGIDVGTIGSNTVSITNNKFYQTGARALNATAIHSAIRIVNTGLVNGFVITGNTIGYSNALGTGTYNFSGTVTGAVFNPINLTLLGTTTSTSVQNNTIAGISHSTSFVGFFTLFNAINVTAGNVNIGTVTGNTIGLPAAPITFNSTVAGGGTINGISTASTATINIRSNTIQSITGTGIAAAAFDFNGIILAGAGTFNVTSNIINSINLGILGTSTVGSTFRGIISPSPSGVSGSYNVGGVGVGNTIQNITLNAAALNNFIGIGNLFANTNTSINYNIIKGIRFASTANNNFFRGILVNPLGATSNTITYNTIDDMIGFGTGTGSLVRGIEVGGSGNATINNNNISNISTSTTNTAFGTTTPIVGIYYGSTGAASTITGNTIFSLNATSAGAFDVSVAAIVTGTSGGGTIAKNRIYDLTNTTTGNAITRANYTIGFLPNGGSWTVANNMISITNNNTVRAIGVFDVGAAGTRNYYYNSIYISGTHLGTQGSTAFQFNAATGTADIKNNIFVMARTGGSGAKNYAFTNAAANFTNITTNYNVLNCTVASTIGFSNGADRDFAAWKTASGGDTNSYSGIVVSFANDPATGDLHLGPACTDIESGGTPVAILDDYDAVARNANTPDIGADEFAGTRPADITLTPNSPLCLGSSITLNATSTDLTYVYTWSPATGLSATTGASVIANPIVTTTYTVTGTSAASCVKLKEVTITVNPLPTPIAVSPPSVTLCPNTIQAFTAAPSSGTAIVGTANAIAATVNNTPYRQASSTNLKIQYLMTKAELNAAGFYGGNITALAFNVTVVGTNVMPVYNISLAHTNASALTTNYIATGLTQVYTGINILPVLGLNTHTFSTAFAWDGTSNIVVNICHTGTGNGGNPFSQVTLCTPATLSTNSETNIACNALTGVTNIYKPVITLTYVNPITWSPATELYTDAAATIPYNAATYPNLATVYTKPTVPRVYTASSTITTTGCPSTNTGTITMSGKTWDGVTWTPPGIPTGNTSLTFTGSYTSSGNLSGCSCTVTGGNVVFNGPDALILTNGLTVTAPGTIKFNNNSSLVQIDDTAVNTGIITMERITPPIYRFDYTYWGTPVTFASNYTLGMLSPETLPDKFFSWTPTIASGPGNWFSESPAETMDPIKGYIVRGPQTYSYTSSSKLPYTANFIGTPNNGVISAPIYHGTIVAPGPSQFSDDWNLLGNPYPSAVSALSFLSNPTNTPIIDGTIYFWTHNSDISSLYLSPFYGTFVYNYNNSDYATWNRVGSVGSAAGTGGPVPGGFIAAGQGFFTKSTGTAPSGNSVIFNNSMRVAGNNSQFYRMASPPNVPQENNSNDPIERQRLWLNLSDESGAFNQILIGYVEGATTGWDSAFDGVRLTDQTSATLYSNLEDKKLVIQGRPLPFQETDEVPLGYRVNISGNNTFAIDRVDDSFSGQNIYIEDRVLNIVHNLRISPYTFASEAGTFNDRFVLRYTDASLSANEFDANQNVTAFIFSNELQVKSSKNIVAIEVFDISGKLIQKYNPSEVTNEFITRFGFAQGVYLAKIKLDNGIEVTKKVIH